MTVRSANFVNSAIRVQKARGGNTMSSQIAITGSIERQRFSGWEEQELGTKTNRTRLIQLAARGGNFTSTAAAKSRFKPGREFTKPEQFSGKDKHQRGVAMLQVMGRKKTEKPFLIHGHKRIKPGLYRFIGRKLKMLQATNPGNVQPKKKPWLRPGRDRFMSKANLRLIWAKAIDFQLKRNK